MQLSAKKLRRLKRNGSIATTATAKATDGAGNTTVARKAITVTRAAPLEDERGTASRGVSEGPFSTLLRMRVALVTLLLASFALLPAAADAKLRKRQWITNFVVTEYWPVPENWFTGKKVSAPGLKRPARIDWLYSARGVSMEGDGVDSDGRRVHIDCLGRAGWINKKGRRTVPGSDGWSGGPPFWRNARIWFNKRGLPTFPLSAGGWSDGKGRRYSRQFGYLLRRRPVARPGLLRLDRGGPRLHPARQPHLHPRLQDPSTAAGSAPRTPAARSSARHLDVFRPPPAERFGNGRYLTQAAGARRPAGEGMSAADAARARARRQQQMSEARKKGLRRLALLVGVVVVVLVLAVVVLGGGGDDGGSNGTVYRDAADTQGPLDILTASMDQRGPQLVLNLRTADLWTPGQLAEEAGRSVCVQLYAEKGSDPRSKVCVVSQANTPTLQLTRYREDGTAEAPRPMTGSIRRRTLRSLEASFSFKDAKLPLGKFRWQVTTLWAGGVGAAACPPAATPVVHCIDNLPDNGTSPGNVTKPLLLGCTFTGPPSVLNGPAHATRSSR